ncbi:MAG: hypothetical protein KF724_11330 [Phycisphaeraceae bacterium]|nr:hypothetical protein [Phycisphaeraceae bacterium]
MSDSLHIFMRMIVFLIAPVLLLSPMVVVLLTPTRVSNREDRILVRSRVMVLAVATGVSLIAWAGLTVASVQSASPALSLTARSAWVLFFPLWFMLAMPSIRAKNPVWGGALDGSDGRSEPVRTAMLTNRERENPISRRAWALVTAALVLIMLAIAARGMAPFSESAEVARVERVRWIVAMCTMALCGTLTLAIMPWALRRIHSEPEPLVPGVEAELIEAYRTHRRRKVTALFWLLGVAVPGFLGALAGAIVWGSVGSGETIGLIGGVGGSMLGVAGAFIGCLFAFDRIRIAEARARLQQARGVETVGGSA